jgi:hypothetical protein
MEGLSAAVSGSSNFQASNFSAIKNKNTSASSVTGSSARVNTTSVKVSVAANDAFRSTKPSPLLKKMDSLLKTNKQLTERFKYLERKGKLIVAGMTPGAGVTADAIDLLWAVKDGDMISAFFALGKMIPGGGQVVGAIQATRVGSHLIDVTNKIDHLKNTIEDIIQMVVKRGGVSKLSPEENVLVEKLLKLDIIDASDLKVRSPRSKGEVSISNSKTKVHDEKEHSLKVKREALKTDLILELKSIQRKFPSKLREQLGALSVGQKIEGAIPGEYFKTVSDMVRQGDSGILKNQFIDLDIKGAKGKVFRIRIEPNWKPYYVEGQLIPHFTFDEGNLSVTRIPLKKAK